MQDRWGIGGRVFVLYEGPLYREDLEPGWWMAKDTLSYCATPLKMAIRFCSFLEVVVVSRRRPECKTTNEVLEFVYGCRGFYMSVREEKRKEGRLTHKGDEEEKWETLRCWPNTRPPSGCIAAVTVTRNAVSHSVMLRWQGH